MATKAKDSKSAKLQGQCKWACVVQPNTKYEPVWSVDMVIANKTLAKRLKDAGLNVKEDKDGDTILKIKRKTHSKAGKEMKPPIVTMNGTAFDGLIGNGSTISVEFSVYESKVMGQTYTSAWLNKVDVLDLVEYTGGGSSVDLDFTEGLSEDVPF